MDNCERLLHRFCRSFLNMLKLMLGGWLCELPRLLRLLLHLLTRCCRRYKWRRGQSPVPCMKIPSKFYKRPDPLIYSQKYLKSLGLAVTWNNPDIELLEGGFPVDSHALKPNTVYQVRARVWNNSTEAPAVGLPVQLSYRNFGIGQQNNLIGETKINLPVKGAIGHPAFASINWKTPATAGHYCLLVNLIWPDDANPKNNEGQENTDVKKLNSPHARFEFPLRNDTGRAGVFRLRADAYIPPPPPSCKNQPPADTPEMGKEERDRKLREAVKIHNPDNFAIPPGWRVLIHPDQVALDAEAEQLITVDVTAPEEHFQGRQTFNVSAFDGRGRLVGGVTLTAEG